MQLTKSQKKLVDAQPFQIEKVVEFFSSKKGAKRFLVNFSESLAYGIKAEERGEAGFDTEFDNQFSCWVSGNAFWSEDDYDLIELFEDARFPDCAQLIAYSEEADTSFYLCKYPTGRRFFVVVYEYKDAACCSSAWWLEPA